MPRRIADYARTPGWTVYNLISTVGAFMIAVSVLPFLVNVVATFINGEKVGDDPWEANTLEWATTSPPPPYNFDTLPPDPQRAAGLRPAPQARRGAPPRR